MLKMVLMLITGLIALITAWLLMLVLLLVMLEITKYFGVERSNCLCFML